MTSPVVTVGAWISIVAAASASAQTMRFEPIGSIPGQPFFDHAVDAVIVLDGEGNLRDDLGALRIPGARPLIPGRIWRSGYRRLRPFSTNWAFVTAPSAEAARRSVFSDAQ